LPLGSADSLASPEDCWSRFYCIIYFVKIELGNILINLKKNNLESAVVSDFCRRLSGRRAPADESVARNRRKGGGSRMRRRQEVRHGRLWGGEERSDPVLRRIVREVRSKLQSILRISSGSGRNIFSNISCRRSR
jgi:hypothetical protein